MSQAVSASGVLATTWPHPTHVHVLRLLPEDDILAELQRYCVRLAISTCKINIRGRLRTERIGHLLSSRLERLARLDAPYVRYRREDREDSGPEHEFVAVVMIAPGPPIVPYNRPIQLSRGQNKIPKCCAYVQNSKSCLLTARFARDSRLSAAFVNTCVGSTGETRLRMAGTLFSFLRSL
eukprot:6837801-Pyramimonas_sp.AAC.1